MDIIDIALARRYTKQSLIGLGALRGASCTIKSIVPTYSTVDPTQILYNTITFEWTATDGVTKQTRSFEVENGNEIISIEWDYSTAEKHYYNVLRADGTIDQLTIPVAEPSLKKQVVNVLPDVQLANDSTFYLVPVPGKINVYDQFIRVTNTAGQYEWLSLGSTEMNLTGYQLKIDPNIIKNYKNYDPTTDHVQPSVPNVVGAINTFEKEIGGNYDDASGKVTNLTTLHNNNLVDAINEIGYLPRLETYDTGTGKPDNLVDAINLANKDYEIDKNTTVDRTKYIDTYKLSVDPGDGSPVIQSGQTVFIPRVDITAKTTPDTNDYRTYNLSMSGNTYDPEDTSQKAYGTVHIPKIQIRKIEPVTDPSLAAEYFLSIDGATTYNEAVAGAKIQLQKDLMIKDSGVKQCEVAGVPLPNLAVGD